MSDSNRASSHQVAIGWTNLGNDMSELLMTAHILDPPTGRQRQHQRQPPSCQGHDQHGGQHEHGQQQQEQQQQGQHEERRQEQRVQHVHVHGQRQLFDQPLSCDFGWSPVRKH